MTKTVPAQLHEGGNIITENLHDAFNAAYTRKLAISANIKKDGTNHAISLIMLAEYFESFEQFEEFNYNVLECARRLFYKDTPSEDLLLALEIIEDDVAIEIDVILKTKM
jgi:hypothetical protein